MNTFYPYLPALIDFLKAQRPGSAITQTGARLSQLKDSTLSELQSIFADRLPAHLLNRQKVGIHSRDRVFSLRITFWTFLSQILSPGSSCREAVRKVQALLWIDQRRQINEDTSAYCQARERLAEPTLQGIHQGVVQRLEAAATTEQLWLGRRVRIVDGTTLSMPDTPQNQALYPQASGQKPGCGFPLMKVVGLFSLATGAILSVVKSTFDVHESRLFRQIWNLLKPGDVVLGDRAFCSYQTINLLKQQGVDSVFRLHQKRKADFRKGRSLGAQDHQVIWQKTRQKTPTMSRQDFETLDSELTLRELKITVNIKGFRTRSILLVTTLLDPVAYPKEALAQLFLRRWMVELFFRDIKVTLAMDVLKCKAPEMISKELWMHLIAYNLIRSLMLQAACQFNVELSRISFKGSVDTLRQWAWAIDSARHQKKKLSLLLNSMLFLIAKDLLPHRPHRSEPRAVKKRPKAYQLLNKPRHQMIVVPHRSKYRKPALS